MSSAIPCELISWQHFDQLSRQLVQIIARSSFHPDVIIAIARGGYLPARILSDHLDIFDLDDIKIEHYQGTKKRRRATVRYPLSADITGKKVLLVDDVSDSGDSFTLAVSHLLEHGRPAELKTAVLHHKTVSDFTPDFYAEVVDEWRWITYPWAIMEDLRSFLQEMDPAPTTAEMFGRSLRERHGIDVDRQTLIDVLAGVGNS